MGKCLTTLRAAPLVYVQTMFYSVAQMNKQETRVRDASGGEKGDKLAQGHSIPASIIIELMEHYGKGNRKYPDAGVTPNYARGYKWSLSYNALLRHLFAFWSGEDMDAETETRHIIAVAWHAITLAYFQGSRKGTDDRWEQVLTADDFRNAERELMKPVSLRTSETLAKLFEDAERAARQHDSLGGLDTEERESILGKMTQVPDRDSVIRLPYSGGYHIPPNGFISDAEVEQFRNSFNQPEIDVPLVGTDELMRFEDEGGLVGQS